MYGSSLQRGHRQSLGFLMIGIEGTSLDEATRQQLMHPAVAGVILFSRNYQDPIQLQQLCAEIHGLRHPRLLISVDHEGGRVQRFKQQGFTALPAMGVLGAYHDHHPVEALQATFYTGWLLAAELLACGVDFSFTPVVDLDYGQSSVIGDRAFHHNPTVVASLADALIRGMQAAGMSAVAKHFPGHGYATVDTHIAIAEDPRDLTQLMRSDIQPFIHLIRQHVAGIMIAHIIYPQVDALPAGLSSQWLQNILRGKLGFSGAIISDDLGMQAVANRMPAGELSAAFYQAGCDLVLLCNQADQITEALDAHRHYQVDPVQESRLIRLHGKPLQSVGLARLHLTQPWLKAIKYLQAAALLPSDIS